jgi:hypothetical protein
LLVAAPFGLVDEVSFFSENIIIKNLIGQYKNQFFKEEF